MTYGTALFCNFQRPSRLILVSIRLSTAASLDALWPFRSFFPFFPFSMAIKVSAGFVWVSGFLSAQLLEFYVLS